MLMQIIECLKAALYGVIEGITEWLPISSTGHLILAKEIVPLQVTEEFWEMFEVVIQLGAIFAVLLLFFHKLNPFSPKKSRREKDDTLRLLLKVIVGILPAGIIGVLFDDMINAVFYNYQTVTVTLILYGVLFIVMENYNRARRPVVNNFHQLSYKTALFIGCLQVLALIPGTSRSGATILGAMLLGTSRTVAAEYSFFLSVPVMFGASLLKGVKYVGHVASGAVAVTSTEIAILIVGMVVAFVVSVLAIRFLMDYIKRHDFKVFGWYRIVLGVIVAVYFLLFAK